MIIRSASECRGGRLTDDYAGTQSTRFGDYGSGHRSGASLSDPWGGDPRPVPGLLHRRLVKVRAAMR